jgi:hypothetical protein
MKIIDFNIYAFHDIPHQKYKYDHRTKNGP